MISVWFNVLQDLSGNKHKTWRIQLKTLPNIKNLFILKHGNEKGKHLRFVTLC